MLQLGSPGFTESIQRSNLVCGISFCFPRCHIHISSAKSHQIGKAGMSSQSDSRFLGHSHCFRHNQGIGCVIATGNVGRGNQGDHLIIHTQFIVTKAFSKITIQIYLIHCFVSISYFSGKKVHFQQNAPSEISSTKKPPFFDFS